MIASFLMPWPNNYSISATFYRSGPASWVRFPLGSYDFDLAIFAAMEVRVFLPTRAFPDVGIL